MGWFTAASYFVTSWLCLKCVGREKSGPTRSLVATLPALYRVVRKHWPAVPHRARRASIWAALGVLYFLLGVNKQLDLQSALTEAGRIVAWWGGWYEYRRLVQAAFILAILIATVLTGSVFLKYVRAELSHFALPLCGVLVTVSFVLIRAASFHHMDLLIRSAILGVRVNWVLELGGISLVALGATMRLRSVSPNEA
ncbi:MAG TPA: hypothetical protein VN764_13810 [Polyangiaceae bacterium]|nr:hypothetical protein [Polyangiaceae bacterium]